MTDYAERQRKLRADREASGYYSPEQVAKRDAQLKASREYNEKIGKIRTNRKEKK